MPKESLIGEENKGWTYAKYLLEFERGNPYSAGLARALVKVQELAEKLTENGSLADDKDFQHKLNDLHQQVMVMEATELRIFSDISAGQNIGPGASSLLKTRGTELQQAISELAVEAQVFTASPLWLIRWRQAMSRMSALTVPVMRPISTSAKRDLCRFQ